MTTVEDELEALRRGVPPAWASGWGADEHGVFACFAVGEVEQRMRWVPAGTFLMGSPEGEAGRYDREGPQHEVTLSSGYWMADTPCTQAMWEAVMGTNPSRFPSPKRPVEQVSWNDVQEFVQRLDELVPELGVRLPTEAEWEWACRAGTTTATYAGDLVIRGMNDAPLLDDIAWYGGNSGVDYDLDEGSDSSEWLQKQHPHTKAGTRECRAAREQALRYVNEYANRLRNDPVLLKLLKPPQPFGNADLFALNAALRDLDLNIQRAA